MENQSDLSTSSLTTLDDALQRDKQRYIRKGYGLVVAILITITIFTLLPTIMRVGFQYLQGFGDIQIYLLLTLSSSHLSYVLANLYMWVIYSLKSPFLERYKIDDTQWPWEKDQIQWDFKKKKVFRNWLINSTLSTLISIISAFWEINFRISLESLPTHWEILYQVGFCMVIEDMSFYWLHRLLHHPKLYPKIHKIHHEFYSPISFSAEYSHPIEFVASNILPTMLGPLILGSHMHLATLSFWMIMRVFETIDGHCGYEFSWSPYRLLPFSGSSEYHHFHHSHNIGNYSSFFYYWDTLCGTNTSYFKFREAKQRVIIAINIRKFNYKNQDFSSNKNGIEIYINYKMQLLLQREYRRIKSKGYHYYIALALCLSIFYLAPSLISYVFYKLEGMPENYIYFIVLLPSNYILSLITNIIVEYLYHAKIPIVEQCRLDNKLWPWQQDLKSWEVRKKQVFNVVLINSFIGTSLIIFIGNYFPFLGTSLEQSPTMGTLMWQITFCMIMEDFSNYWLHRTFHYPGLYEKVHKKHHEFYQVIGISAQYSHPIEYIFVTIVTTMLGPLLLGKGMHLGTMCFWTIIRQIEALDAHTGYEFPWCPFRVLPFSAPGDYHHYHHSKNIGNYCSFFTIWDSLCGTNQMYYQDKDK